MHTHVTISASSLNALNLQEKKLLKKGELASAQDTSDQAEGSSDAAEAAAGLNGGAAAAAAAAGDADALD
jgi:hypothetical protein